MARAAERLSARTVQTVKEPGMYPDGKGLYLRIGPTGAKSWIYRYRSDGKRHDLGLGPYPDFTLAEARERAAEQRKLRLNGEDPLLTKRAGRDQKRLEAAKRMTFRECAEGYIEAHRAGWTNSTHAGQWPQTLKAYAYPTLGDLPVGMVDVGLVMKALAPIWTEKPETASRVRNRIELVLDWATARGYRAGDNPARWRGHLDKLLPRPSKAKRAARQTTGRSEHHAAMPYAEIGEFMAKLRRQDGVGPLVLEFTILTAARRGEVLDARWDEFNLAERLWTVPAERMKSGREHRVPLSGAALAIIEKMAAVRASDFVFAGKTPGKPLNKSVLLNTLARTGVSNITVHGFRSTFRDWAAERTSFPAEVAEMALAHSVGDKVEAAYRRGDLFQKRRQLAEAWARFCDTPATTGEKVVAIGNRG